jgi:Dyp-type peroxidase family
MEIEYNDIQSLVFNDLSHLNKATYLLFEIKQGSFKNWLKKADFLTSDKAPLDQEKALQIAFTMAGLQKLGLAKETLNEFPQPFQLGMNGRSEMLGDIGEAAPEKWRWGNQTSLHGMIIFFGASDKYEGDLKELLIDLDKNGVLVTEKLSSQQLAGAKEHFGFKDSISNPEVVSKEDKQAPNEILPGELILGYKNEYNKLGISPRIYGDDPCELKKVSDGVYDFGLNGSFLVFRQLKQKVDSFWKSMQESTTSHEAAVRLASKMVGRWPNGNPLASTNDPNAPEMADQISFDYSDDSFGEKTPLTSHLRRSNPRNSHEFFESKYPLTFEKKHRIMRRGRPYGKPTVASMDIKAMQNTTDNQEEKGLLFLALNASISRQFEFIQNNWNINPKFAASYNDSDPVTGNSNRDLDDHFLDDDLKPTFTIPGAPFPKKVPRFMNFVQMVGGAYFFLPGKKAIEYLAKK